MHLQVLANYITKVALEDPKGSQRLRDLDVSYLEILILVSSAICQQIVAKAWTKLSLQRRCCRDIVLQLEQLSTELLPQEDQPLPKNFQMLKKLNEQLEQVL